MSKRAGFPPLLGNEAITARRCFSCPGGNFLRFLSDSRAALELGTANFIEKDFDNLTEFLDLEKCAIHDAHCSHVPAVSVWRGYE